MTRKQLPIGKAHQPRFKLNHMAKHSCFKRKLDLTSTKAKKAIFFLREKKLLLTSAISGEVTAFRFPPY